MGKLVFDLEKNKFTLIFSFKKSLKKYIFFIFLTDFWVTVTFS